MGRLIAHYGYADGSGEYYLIVDTDRCDGCGRCVEVCPNDILELAPDDYGKTVVRVKDEFVNSIGYICPACKRRDERCESVCEHAAISYTW